MRAIIEDKDNAIVRRINDLKFEGYGIGKFQCYNNDGDDKLNIGDEFELIDRFEIKHKIKIVDVDEGDKRYYSFEKKMNIDFNEWNMQINYVLSFIDRINRITFNNAESYREIFVGIFGAADYIQKLKLEKTRLLRLYIETSLKWIDWKNIKSVKSKYNLECGLVVEDERNEALICLDIAESMVEEAMMIIDQIWKRKENQ